MLGVSIPCLFRLITGMYCPGCGGTRAVVLLMGGHIAGSFIYHPLVVYLTILFLLLPVLYFCLRRKGKKIPERLWKNLVYFGIALTAVNFIIKNYYLLVRHVDLFKLLDGRFGF